MSEAILGAVTALDLIRLQCDIETLLIIALYSRNEPFGIAKGIFPVILIFCGVDQRLLDMCRRFKIRCTDTQVIDRPPFFFECDLFIIECCKNLRLKTV